MRALLLGVLCACTSPQPPPGSAGPAEAVQDLATALQKGDSATAWSLLSTRTQKEADAVAARTRGKADAGADPGRAMLFTSALPGRAVEAQVVSQTGDSAEVRTADDGGGRVYRVVKEGGRWRVDLELPR
jgi:hypothetical protein